MSAIFEFGTQTGVLITCAPTKRKSSAHILLPRRVTSHPTTHSTIENSSPTQWSDFLEVSIVVFEYCKQYGD